MSLYEIANLNTTPVQTHLREAKEAGVKASEVSFPTLVSDTLLIHRGVSHLRCFYMTKNDSGMISLHQLLPAFRVGHTLSSNTARTQQTLTYIAIACNKNQFVTREDNISVVKDSNLAVAEIAFNPESPYNAVTFVGSPNTTLAPVNRKSWEAPYGETTVGAAYNEDVIRTFFYIQKQMALLKDNSEDAEAVEPEVIEGKVAAAWEKYVKQRDALLANNYLAETTVTYVEQASLKNASICFQNSNSTANRFMNANEMYGNGKASYAPKCGFIYGVGTIVDAEVHPNLGFQLGQFASAPVQGQVVAVPADKKATTAESTTRAMIVHDASGRSCTILITVSDTENSNGKITKRSNNLADLPVGTTIMFRGDLQLRSHAGSFGVTYRVIDTNWTSASSLSNSTMFVAGESTLDLDNLDNLEDLGSNSFENLVNLAPQPVKEEEPQEEDKGPALSESEDPSSTANF